MKRYSDCPASSWRYAANVEDFECGKCGLTSIEWRAGDSTETVYLPQDKILSQLSVKENVQNPQLHFSTHLHIISLNICRNRSKELQRQKWTPSVPCHSCDCGSLHLSASRLGKAWEAARSAPRAMPWEVVRCRALSSELEPKDFRKQREIWSFVLIET